MVDSAAGSFHLAAAPEPMAEQDAKLLVERLVGDDPGRLLLKIKNRFDRCAVHPYISLCFDTACILQVCNCIYEESSFHELN